MARRKLIKGGALLPTGPKVTFNIVPVMFVLVLILSAGIMYMLVRPKKVVVIEKRVEVPSQPMMIPMPAPPAAPTEPPVYPRENPQYPLRRVQTQHFQQVGVLVSQDANEDQPILLGLFGKKKTNDRWEYYVASDKYHMWRLPIQVKNRMCDEDVGCEEIYNGDEIVVPDYANKVFNARMYKYAAPVQMP